MRFLQCVYCGIPLLLTVILSLSSSGIQAQEEPEPYTAEAYWMETQNRRYVSIQKKLAEGLTLSDGENIWYQDYTNYLDTYWDKMTDREKNRYYEMRATWEQEAAQPAVSAQDTIVQAEDKEMGREATRDRYNLLNGVYGLGYGIAANVIFGVENDLALVAIPIATAGVAMLMPVLNPAKYENMTYQSALLARHGKFNGAASGIFLGGLLNGFNSPELPLVLGVAGSIAMGEIGFQLGRKKSWSLGRVGLYRHYGITTPVSTLLFTAAFTSDARVLSAGYLAGAAAGYFIGNSIADKYDFTLGDVWTTSNLTFYSTVAGLGILAATQPDDASLVFIVPSAFTMAGSLLSHRYLKGAQLSSKQAFWTSTVGAGSALLGLALSTIINGDESLYFLLPAAGGFAGILGMVNHYRKQNIRLPLGKRNRKTLRNLSLSLAPQNIWVNGLMEQSQSENNVQNPSIFRSTGSVVDLSFRF